MVCSYADAEKRLKKINKYIEHKLSTITEWGHRLNDSGLLTSTDPLDKLEIMEFNQNKRLTIDSLRVELIDHILQPPTDFHFSTTLLYARKTNAPFYAHPVILPYVGTGPPNKVKYAYIKIETKAKQTKAKQPPKDKIEPKVNRKDFRVVHKWVEITTTDALEELIKRKNACTHIVVLKTSPKGQVMEKLFSKSSSLHKSGTLKANIQGYLTKSFEKNCKVSIKLLRSINM